MDKDIVILFRKDITTEPELEIAKKYFKCVEYRSEVPKNSFVVARYSALPFYNELEKDLKNNGSILINSHREHKWIADFIDYYEILNEYTFPTWRESEFQYCQDPGPFIVKGLTNSKKHQWSSRIYAKDKRQALDIASELANDPLIGPQGLIYRKYIPLKTLEICPISGLPFSNEWRFFFYKNTLLSYGFYWSIAENPEKGVMTESGMLFAKEVASKVAEYVNFFVVDIAEKEEKADSWILVELNDGTMSGLSMNDPDTLYKNLKEEVSKT